MLLNLKTNLRNVPLLDLLFYALANIANNGFYLPIVVISLSVKFRRNVWYLLLFLSLCIIKERH